jgi:hypothetical protein
MMADNNDTIATGGNDDSASSDPLFQQISLADITVSDDKCENLLNNPDFYYMGIPFTVDNENDQLAFIAPAAPGQSNCGFGYTKITSDDKAIIYFSDRTADFTTNREQNEIPHYDALKAFYDLSENDRETVSRWAQVAGISLV